MKVYNDKAEWIKTLAIASDSITTTAGNPENVGITFITNFGFIVASISELKELPGETEDELKESLAKAMETGLDAFSANTVINRMVKKQFEENGDIFEESGKQIVLDKAEIIYSNNLKLRLKVDRLAISVDQIVGVIPGRIYIPTE